MASCGMGMSDTSEIMASSSSGLSQSSPCSARKERACSLASSLTRGSAKDCQNNLHYARDTCFSPFTTSRKHSLEIVALYPLITLASSFPLFDSPVAMRLVPDVLSSKLSISACSSVETILLGAEAG